MQPQDLPRLPDIQRFVEQLVDAAGRDMSAVEYFFDQLEGKSIHTPPKTLTEEEYMAKWHGLAPGQQPSLEQAKEYCRYASSHWKEDLRRRPWEPLQKYMPAWHGWSERRFMEATFGEIADVLRADMEKWPGAGSKANPPSHSALPVPAPASERTQALLSAPDLARHLGMDVSRVESALRRYREKYPDCYVETEPGGRRRNEPKYLYRAGDVLPHLQKLRDGP